MAQTVDKAMLPRHDKHILHVKDASYIVEEFMRIQESSDVLYLKSRALPAEVLECLRSPGDNFSVAVKVAPATKMLDDGPTLFLEFMIPTSHRLQVREWRDGSYCNIAVPEPIFQSGLSLSLAPAEASEYLMSEPSPLYPSIN